MMRLYKKLSGFALIELLMSDLYSEYGNPGPISANNENSPGEAAGVNQLFVDGHVEWKNADWVPYALIGTFIGRG